MLAALAEHFRAKLACEVQFSSDIIIDPAAVYMAAMQYAYVLWGSLADSGSFRPRPSPSQYCLVVILYVAMY